MKNRGKIWSTPKGCKHNKNRRFITRLQDRLADLIPIAFFALVLIILWRIDPALVEPLRDHVDEVLPACLGYYLSSS